MGNHRPVRQDSPPPSFQEHDASLGSSSANPAPSYHHHSLQSRRRYHDTIVQPATPATTSEDGVGSEQQLADSPSTSQQAALTALQEHDNGTIFAWLTGLRSFTPGGKNWFRPDSLLPQEFEAILALKDCTDSLISAWLDCIRSNGSFHALQNASSRFAIEKAAATSMRNTWQASSNASRSSSSSFGPPTSPYDSSTSPSTPRSSWSRGTFLDLSQEPSIDEIAAILPAAGPHTHWCFVCENPRKFTTCDGWKRHMKEHETRYRCMPQGHEFYTAHGPECVLCGLLNPDERHYNSHKILPCFNRTLVARSYTRKSHLINHLKTHGISDGSALAEEWRDTLDKKYFSCGFCIACFPSHMDQLNHIDSAHYKKHQHISEWDSSRVILGLLLQPGVQESWRAILAVHPQFNASGFRWSLTAAKSLQLRLEKSEEIANDLALAAFNESTCDWIHNIQMGSIPVAGFSSLDVNILRPEPTAAQTLSTPNQSSAYDGRMMHSPLQAQQPAWRSVAANYLCSPVLNVSPTIYQNNSSQELMMTDRRQNFCDAQLEYPPSCGDDWAPPQSPNTPHNGSISTASNAYGSQTATPSSSAADANWQATSYPEPLAAHSGHHGNNSAGRASTSAATQHYSSVPNTTTSSMIQATGFPRCNGPSLLPARPTKRPSRTKLKDHYDIDTEADMDIDLDDIQYFMREEGHTRSEKRRR